MMTRKRTSGAPDPSGAPRTSSSPEVVDALHAALSACPKPGAAPTDNPWHGLLYERLRDQALPALIADDTITPAASLWTGSRLWTQAFRNADLAPGDRLVIALPFSAAFVQVLVAALWEGLTVTLIAPTDDVDAALDTVDARGAVLPERAPYAWVPEGCAGPRSTPNALRSATTAPTPDVRFVLRTSGTTGLARWIALSDRNVLSVLASHLPKFRLGNARVLSVLPWSHAFGLVLDLFPALLAGAEIIRDPDGGRRADSLLHLSEAWGATHLSAVPLTIQRLAQHDRGPRFLKHLQGGIVGGAPISAPLADLLSTTRLRVGYGQTEAAPGIALGEPGEWTANYLGRPLGCSVSLADDGELLFEGPNACMGSWSEGTLHRLDPDRTVATGDLATRDGDRLFFRGRKDDAFKLSNGRLVQAGYWEARLKRAFPAFGDALVYSPDGTAVAVALRLDDAASEAPSDDAVRSVLGSLGQRLATVHVLRPDAWPSTPKGTVDREALASHLTADAASDAELNV